MANNTSPEAVCLINAENNGIPRVTAIDLGEGSNLEDEFEDTAREHSDDITTWGRLLPGEKYLVTTIVADKIKKKLGIE